MKMKNMVSVFLLSILLVSLAGCAAAPKGDAGSQPSGQAPESQSSDRADQTSDADILSKLYEMQVLREILELHENVAENSVYYNPQGEETLSIYQYADGETRVWEDSNSCVDIQYQDGYCYVKSCGENGRLAIMFADGYEKLYLDEACTQESTPSDENGERTLYTVKQP